MPYPSVLKYVKPFNLLPYPGAGCVLWLPGQDDAYSATIRDRSGKGNHGTITGATWVRLSSGLWVLSFDGTDDYVYKTNPSFIDDEQGAISLWVYQTAGLGGDFLTTSVAGATDDEFRLFTHPTTKRLIVYMTLNGAIVLQLNTAGDTFLSDQWNHVWFNSDGSTLTCRINDVAQTLTVYAGANSGQWFGDATDANTFTLGGLLQATLVNDFTGRIALPIIFNTSQAASMCTNLRNQQRRLLGV